MRNESREAGASNIPVLPAGHLSIQLSPDPVADAPLWLTGGLSLVLWTALALLLTTA